MELHSLDFDLVDFNLCKFRCLMRGDACINTYEPEASAWYPCRLYSKLLQSIRGAREMYTA